jgi:hypothetical protein
MRYLLPLLVAVVPFAQPMVAGRPVRAQDGPGAAPILACTAAVEGTVSCMSEKLCVCRFDPGGTLTGRPPRHRWDCGIERPSCGTVPADVVSGGYGGAGPIPIAPIQPQVLIPFGGHGGSGWR